MYLAQPPSSVQVRRQSTVREERSPRRFGRVVKLWYAIVSFSHQLITCFSTLEGE